MLGASTILVSNFMLGHGPWTPYQMLGLGLVGFIAGAIPHDKKTSLLLLTAYSVFAAFLYGLITDVFFWSAFAAEHNLKTFIAIKTAGLLMDSSRALGNIVFMIFLGAPLLKILARFKKRFTVVYIN